MPAEQHCTEEHCEPVDGRFRSEKYQYDVPDARPTYELLRRDKLPSGFWSVLLKVVEDMARYRCSGFVYGNRDVKTDITVNEAVDWVIERVYKYCSTNYRSRILTDVCRLDETDCQYSLFVGKDCANNANDGILTKRSYFYLRSLCKKKAISYFKVKSRISVSDGEQPWNPHEEQQFLIQEERRIEVIESILKLMDLCRPDVDSLEKTDPRRFAWFEYLSALLPAEDYPELPEWVFISEWMDREFSDYLNPGVLQFHGNGNLKRNDTLDVLQDKGIIVSEAKDKSAQHAKFKRRVKKTIKDKFEQLKKGI